GACRRCGARPAEPGFVIPSVAVAPAPGGAGAAPAAEVARGSTTAPSPRPVGGIVRGWDGRRALSLGLASVLLAAGALLWTPERTVSPVEDEVRSGPGAAPTRGGRGGAAQGAPSGSRAERVEDGAGTGAVSGGSRAPAAQDVTATGAARQLLDEINAARAGDGRAALDRDLDLETVADKHVREMVAADRLFHTRNQVLGRRVTNWEILAESIGVGPSVSALMDAFMSSAVDRRNLLDPAFEHVGVAARPQGSRLWVTVLFSDGNNPGTTLPRG
ncbi:MAG TPA: CAP domain-containing protein, partial [Actinomycetota bacterium]|nr:CAP domain-containing protein [Actinomycetota bacterium]